MRCLILGGGGFLGSHLCDALLRAGHAVRIFDRPNLRRFRGFGADEQAEWMEGDFTNPAHLAAALEDCGVVYHLVSTTLAKSSNENPVYDLSSNVVSTLHLLDLVRQGGMQKVVFISSGGTVYGMPEQIPIPESHPTQPLSSYGIGKLTVEKYLYLYRHLYGLDYCVLRLSNPFGERQRVDAAQGAVTVFLHRALSDQMIDIWGDGSVIRDYIYVGDVAHAMLLAASHRGEERVLNIGSGQGRSLNDILADIEQILGRPVARRYLPGRPFDVPANVLDITQARNALGWQPVTGFQEGLRRTREWMLQASRNS